MLNPEFFGGLEHLQQEVTQLEGYVRSVPLIDGASGVMLPGDPERLTKEKRLASGIPLDDGNWKALVDLAKQLGVPSPAV